MTGISLEFHSLLYNNRWFLALKPQDLTEFDQYKL